MQHKICVSRCSYYYRLKSNISISSEIVNAIFWITAINFIPLNFFARLRRVGRMHTFFY